MKRSLKVAYGLGLGAVLAAGIATTASGGPASIDQCGICSDDFFIYQGAICTWAQCNGGPCNILWCFDYGGGGGGGGGSEDQ